MSRVRFRAGLVGAIVGCAITSAEAQREARSDDFLGLTHCEAGVPVTRLREDVARSDLAAEIEAHEAVHREQAHAFASCDAFLASLGSARRIIDVELPAYCAQFRVVQVRRPSLSPAQVDSVQREFAWRIAAQSGAMENRLHVVERFRQECPAQVK